MMQYSIFKTTMLSCYHAIMQSCYYAIMQSCYYAIRLVHHQLTYNLSPSLVSLNGLTFHRSGLADTTSMWHPTNDITLPASVPGYSTMMLPRPSTNEMWSTFRGPPSAWDRGFRTSSTWRAAAWIVSVGGLRSVYVSFISQLDVGWRSFWYNYRSYE